MKTRILLIVMLGLVVEVSTNAQITFQKTYGGTGIDIGVSCNLTHDEGYIITGGTTSLSPGSSAAFLIKTDANGDTLWTKTYGDFSAEGCSVQQTFDGGYVFTGFYTYSSNNNQDIYLVKTNSIGEIIWSKTYGNSFSDGGNSVQQTNDGGYIIAGQINYNRLNSYTGDVYLIKTDSMGDTLWTRIFGGANYDCAVSVLESNDNGFILAGVTRSFGAGADDIYLIKTNANGDTLWTKTYGGIHDDDPSCIQKTNDGGYIICGFTYSFGAGLADVYVIKIDSIGDTLWTKTYGGSNFDCGEFIQQTLDSGYIICGVTNSFGAGDYDVYLIKTNSLGDTLWTKTFGGANYDAGYSAFQCRHGGYIICGCTQSFGIDSNNVYFIKTDESGNTYCHQGNTSTISTTPLTQITNPQTHISLGSIVNIPQTLLSSGMINTNICSMVGIIEINPTPSLLLSPNPFSTQATLTFQGIKNENYKTLSVYNILGQEVQNIFVGAATSITINRNNLPSGMYFYKLYDESKTVLGIGKMMVE